MKTKRSGRRPAATMVTDVVTQVTRGSALSWPNKTAEKNETYRRATAKLSGKGSNDCVARAELARAELA